MTTGETATQKGHIVIAQETDSDVGHSDLADESANTTNGPATAESTQQDDSDVLDHPQEAAQTKARTRISWSRIVTLGVLPVVAMALGLAAAFLKWQDESAREAYAARGTSVQSARDASVALLSYRPDTADKQLGAARDLLTGTFKDAYTKLTRDVVIPGAKQKQISAVASVAAATSVSANPQHAVVLVFIDQTVIVGNDAPTATSSAVRVGLDKVGERWLVSKFDPV